MHKGKLHGQCMGLWWPLRGLKINTFWRHALDENGAWSWSKMSDSFTKIECITGVMFMILIETWKFHKLRAKGNLTHSNHYGVTACFWTLSEIFTSWGFIITNAFSDYKNSGQTKSISHDSEASYLLLLLAFKIVMLWKCWFSILVIHSVL